MFPRDRGVYVPETRQGKQTDKTPPSPFNPRRRRGQPVEIKGHGDLTLKSLRYLCGVHGDPKDDHSRDTKEPVIYKTVSPRFKMPGQWSWLPLNTTHVVVALRSTGGPLGKSWSTSTPGLQCNVPGSLNRENNPSLIAGTQIGRGSCLGHL